MEQNKNQKDDKNKTQQQYIPTIQQIMSFKIDQNVLLQNKQNMIKILKQSPKVGVYKDQTKQDWQYFFKFYINFVMSQIGPRGQCSKKIREQLSKDHQKVDQILFKVFNNNSQRKLTHKTHIREILVKFYNYTPCQEYIEIQKLDQVIVKFNENLEKLKNPLSPLCISIKLGMLEKKTDPKKKKKEKKQKKQKKNNNQNLNADGDGDDQNKESQNIDQNKSQQVALIQKKVSQDTVVVKQQKIQPKQPQKPFEEVYEQKIKECIQNYQLKLADALKRRSEKFQSMNKKPQYHNYMQLKNYMKKYFDMWILSDQNIGRESVNRGKTFQDKVYCQAMGKIIRQSQKNKKIPQDISKVKILTNCRWNPRQLGQIDIVLGYYDDIQKRYRVAVLIQCKSRMFDIREAFKQVNNQQLAKSGKNILSTSLGLIKIQPDTEYYIITTLPQYDFQFPIQSKMKETLDKNTKNIPIDQIDPQILYKVARQRFQNELSPLQWMLKNDNQKIVVMKP